MTRLLRFLGLPFGDKGLLIRTFFLVCAVRFGLWVLPFDRVRRKVKQLAKPRDGIVPPPADKLIRAVEITAKYVPFASCLTQAFAAQILLGRARHPATLRIGVLKAEQGGLKAHAWIEREGQAVLGEMPNLAQFTPFPEMP